MATIVDLNSDMGESFGVWKMGHDADMLEIISSANVACGFHAGDPAVAYATIEMAAKHGVRYTAQSSLRAALRSHQRPLRALGRPGLAPAGRRHLAHRQL